MKRLQILGSRGIPAKYGGFEQFAEKLSLYLKDKGWEVTVYCQEDGSGTIFEDVWRGIHLIHIPVSLSGAKGTVLFDWWATCHAAKRKMPTLILGYNTALFCLIYRLKGMNSLINMDGIEWRREKWSLLERTWLYINEKMGCLLGSHLIADHPEIEKHLTQFISKDKITMIPYTAELLTSANKTVLESFTLKPDQYALIVARPESENSILDIVRAYTTRKRGMPLVILGNYNAAKHAYQGKVLDAANDEVRIVGAIYDQKTVQALRFYARFYVHGHTVGGTNPSLVEALGAGSAVLAHNNRFNRWVAGDGALFFSDEKECEEKITRLIQDDHRIQAMKSHSKNQYLKKFIKENVYGAYERLILEQGVLMEAAPISDDHRLLLKLAKPFFGEVDRKETGAGSLKHTSEIAEPVSPSPLMERGPGEGNDPERNPIDWEKVFQLALDNQVAGLLHINIKHLSRIPESILERLEKQYRETAINNLRALRETLGAVKVLTDRHIPVIPLKGAFASDCLFNDFGVYPSSDIDILVHPDHLFEAQDLLCSQLGYTILDTIPPADLLTHHYHLILKKRIAIEIHWNLVKRYFTIAPAFWWTSAKPITWNGVEAMALSLENSILYYVFRLFDHCFYPLRFFVLPAALIDKYHDTIDWALLLQTADRYNMKRVVLFTLLVTHDLLDAHIPDGLLRETGWGYRMFKKLVYSGIFSGINRKHLRMMLYTGLVVDPGITLKVLLRRLFPSKAELRLRYHLPESSRKVLLYYVLNPFLLLLRRT